MQVYFRHDRDTMDEYEVCKKFFDTVDIRTKVSAGQTVICRYSALPFNLELEKDLRHLGCEMLNSSSQHSYVADMGWIYDLGPMTFQTWFSSAGLPDIPMVVKGRTNSRKFEWNTKMYAPDRGTALEIMRELWHDPMIGPQGIVFRKYHPLKTFEVGVNDMPMTNEWRCFFYKGQLVDFGYYWASIDDLSIVDDSSFRNSGLKLAQDAADILKDNLYFFAVDVAEDINGKWWVVEVNDGQMSGLSMIPVERFYANLRRIVGHAG